VLRRQGNAQAAADTVQDAFIEAHRCIHSLRDPARFGAWLRRIALNHCADHLSAEQRRPDQPLADADLDSAALATVPDQADKSEEVRRTVRAAVAALSPANRLAVELFYLDGLSCQEVAEFCGVGVSAIKSRLHEARRHMRKGIEDMHARQPNEPERHPGPLHFCYCGEGVNSLFWGGMREEAAGLYGLIYPENAAQANSFQAPRRAGPSQPAGLRELWLHAGVVRLEGDRVVGLVPVYTMRDHELFAAWHARLSREIAERVKEEHAKIEELTGDFRGKTSDPTNLLHITIVGRLIATGMYAALQKGLFDSAHDWGGLGRAFISGQESGLPPIGGFSIQCRHGGGVRFCSFQTDRGYPGMGLLDEHGTEEVLGLLVRQARSPQTRDEMLAARGAAGHPRERTEALLRGLAEASWLSEVGGRFSLSLPYLVWPAFPDDEARLAPVVARLVEPVADAADEMKVLAAQCSFAHCRFADVAFMLASRMIYYVIRDLRRDGLIPDYPSPIPPGWGAWLHILEQPQPTGPGTG
jgi:RNA polymerase sigma-70 factor (ECF subfamily)